MRNGASEFDALHRPGMTEETAFPLSPVGALWMSAMLP
jgi:hypothetical protein